jgi:hypothetical protein
MGEKALGLRGSTFLQSKKLLSLLRQIYTVATVGS